MKKLNITAFDVKYHFKVNKNLYICFAVFALLGVAIGLGVVFSGDHYLYMLSSNNKILYAYISGTADTIEIFGRKLLSFMVPEILIFLLGLNYYVSFLSYIFVGYQFALFVMTGASLISVYGISGLLNFLLLVLPINLMYFAILVFFAVTCIGRSRVAQQCGRFGYGFDEAFILKAVLSTATIICLTVVACILLPLFLKNANFIIF